MEINVSQQLKEPVGSTRDYELSELVNTNGNASMVEGRVRLMRTDRGILAKASLSTQLEANCSRCLSLFSCPLALSIEEEYFPTTDVITGTSLPLPEEPGCFSIDEHYILDLTEAIRQYSLLVVPMKPLCHEDCAGLCPQCGHNLNLGSCQCPPQQIDPRWAELSKLVIEQKGTE